VKDRPVLATLVATVIIGFSTFFYSQYVAARELHQRLEDGVIELKLRAAAAESLLRTPCINPKERLSQAYLHLLDPTSVTDYRRRGWISLKPQFEEQSSQEILRFLEKNKNKLSLSKDLPPNYFTQTGFRLANVLDTYSIASDGLSKHEYQEQAVEFGAHIRNIYRDLYRTTNPLIQDIRMHSSANIALGKGLTYFEARVRAELDSFDISNDAFWWTACSAEIATCATAYDWALARSKDDGFGYEAKSLMMTTMLVEQSSMEPEFTEKFLADHFFKSLSERKQLVQKTIDNRGSTSAEDAINELVLIEVARCDDMFEAVHPGALKIISKEYEALTETDK